MKSVRRMSCFQSYFTFFVPAGAMVITAVTSPDPSHTASLEVWKGFGVGTHTAFIIQEGCGAPDVTLDPPASVAHC